MVCGFTVQSRASKISHRKLTIEILGEQVGNEFMALLYANFEFMVTLYFTEHVELTVCLYCKDLYSTNSLSQVKS
jgi:hypothetical protein